MLECGEDVLDAGCSAQCHRRFGEAHACGAQADLAHRLFSGDIDGVSLAPGIGSQHLQDEG